MWKYLFGKKEYPKPNVVEACELDYNKVVFLIITGTGANHYKYFPYEPVLLFRKVDRLYLNTLKKMTKSSHLCIIRLVPGTECILPELCDTLNDNYIIVNLQDNSHGEKFEKINTLVHDAEIERHKYD